MAPADPPPTVDTAAADTAVPATEGPGTTARRRSTSTTTPGADPTPSPSPSPTGATAPPGTVAATVQPVVRTFSGDGGAIDVSSDGTTLRVVDTRPNDQYTADVRDASGQRVEVRLSSPWHRTTIRVELRNATMTPVVSESDSGSSSNAVAVSATVATPPTTTGASHGEGGEGGDGSEWDGGSSGGRGPG
jgi:hypothetical protein